MSDIGMLYFAMLIYFIGFGVLIYGVHQHLNDVEEKLQEIEKKVDNLGEEV